MAMIVLSKADPLSVDPASPARNFLAAHGLWLLAIPGLWAIAARFLAGLHPSAEKLLAASGILLCGALLAVYGWVILF